MEHLLNKIDKPANKEEGSSNIHANAIVERKIASKQEVNKWIDALCMDTHLAKSTLGKEIYEITKDQLQVTKDFLSLHDDTSIKQLPEFQEFLSKYILEQEKKEQRLQQEREQEMKKKTVAEMDIPQELSTAKENMQTIKNNIREIIDEKGEKSEGARKTFMDVIRKNIPGKESQQKKSDQIYDFIFEHMESSANKKKRKSGESSSDFYQRIGKDYTISEVRKQLQEREKKINEKINKWKTTAKEKIKTPKQNIQAKPVDYTKEALKEFRSKIDDFPSIKERYYLPEEKNDIQRIQTYMQREKKETIPSVDLETLEKDASLPKNTIQKDGEKIKIHPLDYVEIERRKMEYYKRFSEKDRNAREYLFDRLVEYIGKEVLRYRIQQSIKRNPMYKGTTFTIEKTDPLDDSFAGADYVVTYDIPGKHKERIAAIDLFISDKKTNEAEESRKDARTEKNEGAKKEKIPYSTYLNLFPQRKEQQYTMQPLQRYVDQQEPDLIYNIITHVLKNKNTNIAALLESYEKKGELYDTLKQAKGNQHHIQQYFEKNIIKEIEKVAA